GWCAGLRERGCIILRRRRRYQDRRVGRSHWQLTGIGHLAASITEYVPAGARPLTLAGLWRFRVIAPIIWPATATQQEEIDPCLRCPHRRPASRHPWAVHRAQLEATRRPTRSWRMSWVGLVA